MPGRRATATAAEAFDSVVDFLESFEALDDPRQRGKVLYPLDKVLLLVLLGVLANCECWVEIARFGENKRDLLRRFGQQQTGRRFTGRAAPAAPGRGGGLLKVSRRRRHGGSLRLFGTDPLVGIGQRPQHRDRFRR